MQKVLHFIAHHWLIASAFVIALVILIIEETRSRGLGGGRLSPLQVTHFINREQALILDVRESTAFDQGHIVGAMNIAVADFGREKKRLDKYRDRAIIVVCAQGQRSSAIASQLRKEGYLKVYILSGGMNAWKNANMPVIK